MQCACSASMQCKDVPLSMRASSLSLVPGIIMVHAVVGSSTLTKQRLSKADNLGVACWALSPHGRSATTRLHSACFVENRT